MSYFLPFIRYQGGFVGGGSSDGFQNFLWPEAEATELDRSRDYPAMDQSVESGSGYAEASEHLRRSEESLSSVVSHCKVSCWFAGRIMETLVWL